MYCFIGIDAFITVIVASTKKETESKWNVTETKRKRSLNGFFETRFLFFSKRFNV